MMALLQRVSEASVRVDGEVIGQIGHGLLVLMCAEKGDTEAVADKLLRKLLKLRIFGDEVALSAEVVVLNGYSAHGDRSELRSWLDVVRSGGTAPPRVHLVHGEPEAQDAFAASLSADGYAVEVPSRGDTRPF